MHEPGVRRTALCVLVAATIHTGHASAQVRAEPWFSAGTIMITVEAGGAAFTDFERSRARPLVDPFEPDVFGRRVSAQTAASTGVRVTWWVRDGWGLRAGVSWIPTRFRVSNEDPAWDMVRASNPDALDPEYSSLQIVVANAAVIVQMPHSPGRVMPYGILGGGVVQYRSGDPDELPPEARSRFDDRERRTAAAIAGIGAAIPLQRANMLMTVELTDYIARSPLGSAGAGERFELGGMPMEILRDGEPGQRVIEFAHHLRLAFGLTIPLPP